MRLPEDWSRCHVCLRWRYCVPDPRNDRPLCMACHEDVEEPTEAELIASGTCPNCDCPLSEPSIANGCEHGNEVTP